MSMKYEGESGLQVAENRNRKNLLIIITLLFFDNREQRFTFHSLFLFQFEQLLAQHILVALSQPGSLTCNFIHTFTFQENDKPPV